jgi:hypothetical protein
MATVLSPNSVAPRNIRVAISLRLAARSFFTVFLLSELSGIFYLFLELFRTTCSFELIFQTMKYQFF